ncbi:hypothetical protein YC2023_013798 [Brassica napus]
MLKRENKMTGETLTRPTRQGGRQRDTWMHLNHQTDTHRIRLDLTAAVSKHHRNHLTTTYFRRSSETTEPPSKPSQFFQTLSTRRRASSLFESSSDKAYASPHRN